LKKEKIKFSFLVFFGLILAFACLAWSLGGNWQLALKTPKATPFSPKETLPEVSLNLDPEEKAVYQGEALTVNIIIQSEKELVGIDLYLAYDPQVLEIIKIAPGDFLTNPQELSQEINAAEGKIFYALTTLTPKVGQGTLASLTFKGKLGGQQSLIQIDEKTRVAIQEEEEIVLNLPKPGEYSILKSVK
jgi:hypothetical protein